MKALITGITGFVGIHLAEHLLSQGDRVVGVSRSARWPATAPDALVSGIEVLKWDIGESAADEATRSRLADFAADCVYHLAALSVPADCGKHEPTEQARQTNVEGTRRAVQLAAGLPGPPKFLFISSSKVYAPVDSQAPRVDESSPVGPNSGYGKTKLAAEGVIRQEAPQLGVAAIIVRAFQHTGPGQSARMMLPQWAEQLVRDETKPIEVYTRDASIDLTDVRDVVRAYRLLIQHGNSGQVYNVGSGICRKSGDVLEMLLQHATNKRDVIERRPGFKQDPIAIIDRLAAATGWQPRIPFERTVADTYEYWRKEAARTPAHDRRAKIT